MAEAKDFEEYCPFCDDYTPFNLEDVDKKGFIVCNHCKQKIHACSICAVDMDGESCGKCGWSSKKTNNKWKCGVSSAGFREA